MSTSAYFSFEQAAPNPSVKGVYDISPKDLTNCLGKVCVVDVRRPDEWVGEYGHIEPALLITLDTLPMRQSELPTDKTIVFVCRSGGRSARAAEWAKENGFAKVYNMQGGMIEWSQNGYPSVNKNKS